MAADLFENCKKNAEPVQNMIESNMMMIRNLDVQCELIENEAKQKLANLISNWKKLSKEQQRIDYEAVESCFARVKELCDRKIEISSKTYEGVDEFIQKLDSETAEFNHYVQQKQLDATNGENVTEVTNKNKANNGIIQFKNNKKGQSSSATNTKKNIRSRKSAANDIAVEPTLINEAEPAHGDMPVDPNEPRYCICNQVSFGHMVCCDNKNCPLEWFHFSCVGLSSSPKGKWYCPQCEDKEGKKQPRQKIARKGKDLQDG